MGLAPIFHDRFMIDLNNNDIGIRFQHESSRVEVNFLDLRIRVVEGLIITSTYFKEINRNGFISTDSCHHPAWLRSVLVSQFLKLKRNCTNCSDFLREASALRETFLEKGYVPCELDHSLLRANEKDRNELLVPRIKEPSEAFQHAFFTTFSTQQYAIKQILYKQCVKE